MKWSSRRERLRELVSGTKCITPGSVFDPISARIAEDLGYEASVLGGSVASLVVCGAPDIALITLSELSALAYRICRASDVPLVVDADHGYGNALNVMRTVEELEVAGVAALSIEDTVLPKDFGSDNLRLLSLEEGVGKMRAALQARQDKSLMIIGRTNALVNGFEDAIKRAKAYEAAGVDGVLVVGAQTRDQIDRVAQEIKCSLVVASLKRDACDQTYLDSIGARLCLLGHSTFTAIVQAAYDALKGMRESLHPEKLSGLASSALFAQVTREDQYQRWDKEFLGGKGTPLALR